MPETRFSHRSRPDYHQRRLLGAIVAVILAATVAITTMVTASTTAFAAEPCNPTTANWPQCLPTNAQLARATRTDQDSAYFWTGGAEREAGEIAADFRGTTLEQALQRADVALPQRPAPRSPEGDRAWEFASRSLAQQASGTAFVIVGRTVRPNNVWESIERPELQANPRINCIIRINIDDGVERIIYVNRNLDPRLDCQMERARRHAERACPQWEANRWPHQGGTTRPAQIENNEDPSFRQGEILYGGVPTTFNQSGRTLFSVTPTQPIPSPTQTVDHVRNTASLSVRLRGNVAIDFGIEIGNAFRQFAPSQVGCKEPVRTELRKRDLRVMPLGDSITRGCCSKNSGNGYRKHLGDALTKDENKVDFVGSGSNGDMADGENEGQNGAVISEIDKNEDTATTAFKPNIVLVHAGTNDMGKNNDVGNAPQRLDHLINDVTEHSPDVVVAVATLVPARDGATMSRVKAYNDKIPELVRNRVKSGDKVVLADMSNVTTSDLEDGLHPNDAGYKKMAEAWRDAMAEANERNWIKDPTGDVGGGGNLPGCTGMTLFPKGKIAGGLADGDQVRLADLNGDGRDDYLVVDEKTGAVDAHLNGGGTANDWVWHDYKRVANGVSQPGHRVRFADINGDKRDDYLTVGDFGKVDLWINGGGKPNDWIWHKQGTIAAGVNKRVLDAVNADATASHTLRFGDINGDLRDDYLVADRKSGYTEGWILSGDAFHPRLNGPTVVALGAGSKPWLAPGFANIDCNIRAEYLRLKGSKDTGIEGVEAWHNNGLLSNGGQWWVGLGEVAGAAAGENGLLFADMDGDGRDDYVPIVDKGGALVDVYTWKP